MSVKATTAVWEQSKATGTKKLVLLAIADHADPVGVAWPSVARLGKMCRIAPRNIQKHLTHLEEIGELLREKNAGKRGTNRYQILLDFTDNFKKNGVREPLTKSSPCQNHHPDESGVLGVTESTPGGDDSVLSPLTESSPEPPRTTKNREREPLREAAPLSPSLDLVSSMSPVAPVEEKNEQAMLRLGFWFPKAVATLSRHERKNLDENLTALVHGLSCDEVEILRIYFVDADDVSRGGKKWPRGRGEFLANYGEAVEKILVWWQERGGEWWERRQETERKREERQARVASKNGARNDDPPMSFEEMKAILDGDVKAEGGSK